MEANDNAPKSKPTSIISINPTKMEFQGFKVGRLYTELLTITNEWQAPILVSIIPTRSSRLYFQVEAASESAYSQIAVGASVQYNILFTAQLNQNIQEYLEVYVKRAVDGRSAVFLQKFLYPVECHRRTVNFSCSLSLIDFGKVILKEKNSMVLDFVSEGVESVDIVIENQQGIPLHQTDKLSKSELECISQLNMKYTYQTKGQLLEIPIQYCPKVPGEIMLNIQLSIKNFLEFPPIKVQIRGQCIELPVISEKTLHDMRICMVGHIYKQKLIFQNRSSNSMKIQIVQPNQTRKHFEFNPVLGFIQKNSKIEIWVKFNVQRDTASQLAKYLVKKINSEGKKQQFFEVPFKLMAVAQQAPVDFKIGFQITTDKLTITPQIIDFGKIYSGTASKYEIYLKNESMLEQEVMLLPQSKHIFVDENQPVKILPEQTIKCRLIFKSDKVCNAPTLNQESSIKCLIITGNVSTHQLKLNTICTVICPSLCVSHNKINLPVVQIQETYSTVVSLRNDSSFPIIFQVFLPYFQICGLQITPMVRTLGSKQSVELTIQYWSFIKAFNVNMLRMLQEKYAQLTASRQIVKLEESRKKRNLSAIEIAQSSMEELTRLGGRYVQLENGEYYIWLIPIYFKQKDFPDASAEVTYIEISTISIQKTFILDHKFVEFGEIAVGSSSVKQINITNLDPATDVRKSEMHTFSGFEVINSLKRMEMGETFTILIEFKPLEEIDFEQKLILYSDRSMVSCVLKGRGVRPQVQIDPEDGLLVMGNLLPNQISRRSFTINNISKFRVKFKLRIQAEGVKNSDKKNPFCYIPDSGFIQPNNSTEVDIQFNPKRASDKFYNRICIEVAEQKIQKYVYVYGLCHRSKIYARQYVKECMPKEMKKKAQYTYDVNEEDSKLNRIITCVDTDQAEKKIIIGCCILEKNKFPTKYSFRVAIPEYLFVSITCDEAEGDFWSGQERILTFQLVAKEDNMPKISILEGIGEIRQFKAQISVAETNDSKDVQQQVIFEVIFRVYQNQI